MAPLPAPPPNPPWCFLREKWTVFARIHAATASHLIRRSKSRSSVKLAAAAAAAGDSAGSCFTSKTTSQTIRTASGAGAGRQRVRYSPGPSAYVTALLHSEPRSYLWALWSFEVGGGWETYGAADEDAEVFQERVSSAFRFCLPRGLEEFICRKKLKAKMLWRLR